MPHKASWIDWIAHEPGRYITGFASYAGHLVRAERVNALDPAHLDAQANRALMMGRIESTEALNQGFEEILDANPAEARPLIFYYWGKALEQIGEMALSESKLEQARREAPDIEAQMQGISI